MDFSTFLSLVDSNKLFLVEVNPAEEIMDYTWTNDPVYGNLWYTTYDEGFPNKVTEDGTAYTERFTLTEANNNASSFYHDLTNQRLYLHTSGSDSPGKQTAPPVYDYYIIAFSWHYFCNAQFQDDPATYTREQEALDDGGFELWTSATNLVHWTEGMVGASTVNREGTEVYSGGYSVRFDVDGGNSIAYVDQAIVLPPRSRVRLRVWTKQTGAANANWSLRDSTSTVYYDDSTGWQAGWTVNLIAHTDDWSETDIEFYTHADYTNYILRFSRNSAASQSCYFDFAQFTIYREDNYYLPYFQSSDLPSIQQAVSDYHVGAMKMQFGVLKFINDGYWYPKIQDLLWHNKELLVRFGAKGSIYTDEFGTIFRGKTKRPTANDRMASLTVSDKRVLISKTIPATKFWVSDYANLEDGAEGLPIPLMWGEFENIIPVCVDTVAFKYKIANHQLQAISAVYKDGVALATPADYTVDLANGEFTLTADPGLSLITCDAQGRLCDLVDGTYSTNVADILYDVLDTYAEIDTGYLDKEWFLDLKSARTQDHHLYLAVPTSILDIVRRLQASALFHLIPMSNGNLAPKRYTTGVTADTPRLLDEDYGDFDLIYDTSGVYSQVKIRYNYNPGDEAFERVIRSSDEVEWGYDEAKTFSISSTLKVLADAQNLGDYYIDLLRNPQRKVKANIPTFAFDMLPADKVIVNKTRDTEEGTTIDVLTEEPYRVLDLKKNIHSGRVDIIALEDLQSAGETYCEVCYTCQVCNTLQGGACASCFSCEKCDTGECGSCQSCYYCQKCDAGECAACEVCDACQLCNAGECAACESCDVCEKCDSGECASCQICDVCQKCDAGECAVCENCDACQVCVACEAAQCTLCVACEVCDACQNSQCSSCEYCNSCQICNTCQNDQCSGCEVCDGCQICNSCEKCDMGECTSCEVCVNCENCAVCEKCDTGECSSCESCNICQSCNSCQVCDTGECCTCQSCNTCEKCNTGECTSCEVCVICEKCNTGQCASCENCNICQNCNSCENCVDCQQCFALQG